MVNTVSRAGAGWGRTGYPQREFSNLSGFVGFRASFISRQQYALSVCEQFNQTDSLPKASDIADGIVDRGPVPEPWSIVLANNALTGLGMTLVLVLVSQLHCRTFVAVLLHTIRCAHPESRLAVPRSAVVYDRGGST